MKNPRAEFLVSVPVGGEVKTEGLPVVALAGRSNVGKSSLINALAQRRIARAGAKPGTTRLINIYRFSAAAPSPSAFIVADLPGYGYARGGHQTRRDFDELTKGFFEQIQMSPQTPNHVRLAAVLLVVDIRHPGLESDIDAHQWATKANYPTLIVATKSDRISRSAAARVIEKHTASLDSNVIQVSGKTGAGIQKFWAKLRALL